MKKILYLASSILMVGMFFSSCQKENQNGNDSENVTVSISADASFAADNTKIELTVTGTGPNFKTFKAGLNKLPAMLLSQTDAEDDFLVLYCGTSNILASTEQVNYT